MEYYVIEGIPFLYGPKAGTRRFHSFKEVIPLRSILLDRFYCIIYTAAHFSKIPRNT